jgi:hypothetical protein
MHRPFPNYHADFADSRIDTLRKLAGTLDEARAALDSAISAAETAKASAAALDRAYAEVAAHGDAETWANVDRARKSHDDAEEIAHNTARAAVAVFARLPR